MNSLSLGTDDIVSESGITVTSSPFTVSSTTYVNQSVTYNPDSSYENYFTNSDQLISVSENSVLAMTPDLPWTITGSSSIAFSLSNYNSIPYPTWVSVDPVSGLLTISSPNVTADTVNSFYISSAFTSGSTVTIKKLITITTINWSVQNCQKWSINSGSAWDTWNSGYSVNSGSWSPQISSGTTSGETSTQSSTNSQSASKNTDNSVKYLIYWAYGAAMLIITTTCILNGSSMASLWSLINQVQIFFLLLITNAFIPDSIQRIIKGLEFTLNYPNVIPFTEITAYRSFINKFNIKLSNQSLSSLGVYSDSTFYNFNKFFILQILMGLFTAFIYFLWILLLRSREDGYCKRPILILKWWVSKTYLFMTFGYYIRSILEMTQILLISSINEVYRANITYLWI